MMRPDRLARRVSRAFLFVLCACGSEPSVPIAPPEAPTAVAAPTLAPCAPGWTLEEGICRPWRVAQACGADAAQRPGSEACVLVTGECPSTDFRTDLSEPVVHVRTSSALRHALTDGGVIALAKGRYLGPFVVRAPTTLIGACAETVLTSTVVDLDAATLRVEGGTLRMETLRFEAPRHPGLRIEGATVELSRVSVGPTLDTAIWVEAGGVLDVEASLIADGEGLGLRATNGAQVDLTATVFRSNREVTIEASGADTTVSMSDSAISGTRTRAADDKYGLALDLDRGSRAELRRTLIEDSREVALLVFDDASLLLEDSLVRRTTGFEYTGHGLLVHSRGTAELIRSTIEDSHYLAVQAVGEGTRLDMTDVQVRHTDKGAALVTFDKATARLTRVRVANDGGGGVEVGDALIMAEDLAVEAVEGVGLAVHPSARLDVRGLSIRGSVDHGLSAYGGIVSLQDVAIAAVETSSPSLGRGLSLVGGAAVTVERATLSQLPGVALGVAEQGTELALTDVLVVDAARGLSLQTGATVSLLRVSVEDCADASVAAFGAAVELDEVSAIGASVGLGLLKNARGTIGRARLEGRDCDLMVASSTVSFSDERQEIVAPCDAAPLRPIPNLTSVR